MDILVTGVSGFSGSHIASYLSGLKKYKIFGIYRNPKSIYLEPLKNKNNVKLVKTDLSGISSSNLKYIKMIDHVIHVGSTSPTLNTKVIDLVQDNLIGINSLINWSIEKNCKKFIFFSSMSAFGIINDNVVNENTPISSPDVYGQTKIISETMLEDFKNNIEYISLRLPGIVGPKSQRNWISQLREKLLKNEKIEIFNSTSDFNNLIHINDLSKFLENLIYTKLKHKFLVISSNDKRKIIEIVNYLKSLFNSESKIYCSKKKRKSFIIDSSLARNCYNLETMNLDDALKLI